MPDAREQILTTADHSLRPHISWTATIPAIALSTHFAISSFAWAIMSYVAWRDCAGHRREALVYLTENAGPCLLLFAGSVGALILAIRRKRGSRRLSCLVLALALALFSYDTSRGRYQITVGIATKEYWEQGGRAHSYCTWWWYNDRWFRHKARS